MVNSSLKSDKLEKLGWEGLFSMKEGAEHTIAILKGKWGHRCLENNGYVNDWFLSEVEERFRILMYD